MGGQVERLVDVVKRALYKSIGRASLTWNEPEEVLLDVEVALNNRLPSYVEDDVQPQVLTSCAMMYGQPRLVREESTEQRDADLRKRVKYLRWCKEVLWNRWRGEYLKSLRERHNRKHKSRQMNVELGDVVLTQDAERKRGKLNTGIVVEFFQGRDGMVRAVTLGAGKSYFERAVQHLFPLELSCDQEQRVREDPSLNHRAGEFLLVRSAVAVEEEKIRCIAEEAVEL